MPPGARALVAALALAALTAGTAGAAGTSDSAAVALAAEVMESLGGEPRWQALPGLRWTFGVSIGDTVRAERRHAWNKHDGMHRVEGVDRAGDRYVIVQDLDTGEGRAWVAGQAIEGDSLAKLIERGRALWVNDTYWMLMPYKMRDPGVVLTLEDPVTRDGEVRDIVAMRFEDVGLTPGDRYWVEIDREERRVRAWEMVLQGRDPPPSRYTWEGWEAHDGLWFPTAHRQGDRNVFMRDIETVREFRDGEFATP